MHHTFGESSKISSFEGFDGISTLYKRVMHMEWLFDEQNDVKLQNATDIMGLTPLHYAVILRKDSLARVLLERGADPYRADKLRWIPINYVYIPGQESKRIAQIILTKYDKQPTSILATSRDI